MLNLFIKNDKTTSYSIRHNNKFKYCKERLKDNLDMVVEYYSMKERTVPNNHLLVKLIKNINIDLSLSDIEYFKNVNAAALRVSSNLGIVSDIGSGVIFNNLFYGKHTKEVLVYKDTDIDIFDIKNNWKTYSSIKSTFHTLDNLDLSLPCYTEYEDTGSIFTYEIDVVGLMLQYKQWHKERVQFDRDINPARFVAQIVSPNIVKSILDISLFNRFNNIYNDVTTSELDDNHPFLLIDVNDKVDTIFKDIIKEVTDKNISYIELLKNIPAVSENDMYEVLRLDVKFYTAQSKWVTLISRISIIKSIIDIGDRNGMKRNKDLLNSIPSWLKELRRNNLTNNILTSEINNDMIYLDNLLGKR